MKDLEKYIEYHRKAHAGAAASGTTGAASGGARAASGGAGTASGGPGAASGGASPTGVAEAAEQDNTGSTGAASGATGYNKIVQDERTRRIGKKVGATGNVTKPSVPKKQAGGHWSWILNSHGGHRHHRMESFKKFGLKFEETPEK